MVGVTVDTRSDLRLIKAHEDVHTYDEAIRVALDAYDSDVTAKAES